MLLVLLLGGGGRVEGLGGLDRAIVEAISPNQHPDFDYKQGL